MTTQMKPSLSGNALKLLAMGAMTCDHLGLQLFPQLWILRILGRLALPIFAYMVAEGCRHTKSLKRYLLRLLSLACLCQVVYGVAMGSLYQCILVSFSLSVCLIWGAKLWREEQKPWPFLLIGAGVLFFCLGLPRLVPGFDIDYGLLGVLLPLAAYLPQKFSHRLLAAAGVLVLLGLELGGLQWWGLAALPLLGMYNGQRGKIGLGRFFYWYYPAHLVVIYGLGLLVNA